MFRESEVNDKILTHDGYQVNRHVAVLPMKMLSSPRGKLRFVALACALYAAAGLASRAVELSYSFAPAANNMQLGSGFVGLGDVDADGITDFAVADRSFIHGGTLFSSGQVYVISGRDGSVIRSHEGAPAPSQLFGIALAALDVDGDGISDLAVGAPGHRVKGQFGCGAVWIYSGTDGALLSMIEAEDPVQYGSSLANAGDQDGDGVDDLFVGAPLASSARGEVGVQSGADGSRLWSVASTMAASSFGVSVARLGDIDGDGRTELAVGEPGYRGSSYYVGRVSIFRSSDQARVAEVVGNGFYNRLGESLATADDADGDGLTDLMIGSFSGGTCLAVSGKDLSLIKDLSMPEIPFFNQMVPGGVVDVDGDGVPDWLVGTTAAMVTEGTPYGGLRVFSGVDGAVLLEMDALEPRSGLGLTLKAIPGLGIAAGESLLTDPETGGRGLAYLWAVDVEQDTDGDGMPDSEDEIPDSIMDPTVHVGGVDSGVENRVDERGRTIADEIALLGDPGAARNQGQYVSRFGRLVVELRRDGRISRSESQALHAAAIRLFVSGRGRGWN
jgi:hypothetical protein